MEITAEAKARSLERDKRYVASSAYHGELLRLIRPRCGRSRGSQRGKVVVPKTVILRGTSVADSASGCRKDISIEPSRTCLLSPRGFVPVAASNSVTRTQKLSAFPPTTSASRSLPRDEQATNHPVGFSTRHVHPYRRNEKLGSVTGRRAREERRISRRGARAMLSL